MSNFIFEANIDHFSKLLAAEIDAEKRVTIRKLLAEEKAKLADFHMKGRRSDATE